MIPPIYDLTIAVTAFSVGGILTVYLIVLKWKERITGATKKPSETTKTDQKETLDASLTENPSVAAAESPEPQTEDAVQQKSSGTSEPASIEDLVSAASVTTAERSEVVESGDPKKLDGDITTEEVVTSAETEKQQESAKVSEPTSIDPVISSAATIEGSASKETEDVVPSTVIVDNVVSVDAETNETSSKVTSEPASTEDIVLAATGENTAEAKNEDAVPKTAESVNSAEEEKKLFLKQKLAETLIEAQKTSKASEVPLRCNNYFGYLHTIDENQAIPDECYSCSRLIQCTQEQKTKE